MRIELPNNGIRLLTITPFEVPPKPLYIYIYILDFIYLIPWKFVCDLTFHEVLPPTIIRQITKENEEIEKFEK